MDTCPVCSGKDTGRIGNGQFFCSDCCVEFDANSRVFAIDEDGSLLEI